VLFRSTARGTARPHRRPPYAPTVAALVLAVLVAVVHAAYLVYMTLGGFLALRNIAWLWPHLASTGWSLVVTLTGVTCPLTRLEKWLLHLSGRTPYEDSFIAQYLRGVVYPAEYEAAVWVSAIGLALLSYVVVLSRRRRRVLEPAASAAT
jgi:hypothetical protein